MSKKRKEETICWLMTFHVLFVVLFFKKKGKMAKKKFAIFPLNECEFHILYKFDFQTTKKVTKKHIDQVLTCQSSAPS